MTSVLLRETQVSRPREVFSMEEEVGDMQSLAKEHLKPPEARRGRKESLLDHLEGVRPC